MFIIERNLILQKKMVILATSLVTFLMLLVGFATPVLASSVSVPSTTHRNAKVTHAASNNYYVPHLSGPWHSFTDGNGWASSWTPSAGSNNQAQAVWSFPGTNGDTGCQIYVYVPTVHATANIGYGIFTGGLFGSENRVAVVTLNQQSVSGWQSLYPTGPYNVNQVQLSSNDGATNTQIGVSDLEVRCSY
jgi:hypothetical protein